MQIVLNSDETTEVLACGLRKLHGFDSKIIELDILKQRTGEMITTITLASINGRKVVDEGAKYAEAPAETTVAQATDTPSTPSTDDVPQVNEADPEASGSVFD